MRVCFSLQSLNFAAIISFESHASPCLPRSFPKRFFASSLAAAVVVANSGVRGGEDRQGQRRPRFLLPTKKSEVGAESSSSARSRPTFEEEAKVLERPLTFSSPQFPSAPAPAPAQSSRCTSRSSAKALHRGQRMQFPPLQNPLHSSNGGKEKRPSSARSSRRSRPR